MCRSSLSRVGALIPLEGSTSNSKLFQRSGTLLNASNSEQLIYAEVVGRRFRRMGTEGAHVELIDSESEESLAVGVQMLDSAKRTR